MITIIVAVGKNNVIGKANSLPWYIPEDLKRFKALTLGHTVIMGRKTYESILARIHKPLPDRKNIVITRQSNFSVQDGGEVFSSLDEAIAAHAHEKIFIIGGAEIYNQAMSKVDRLLVTEVAGDHAGDVFFPKIDAAIWREVAREPHDGYTFVEYARMR